MKRKIAACDDSKVMLRQIAAYLEQLQEELTDEIVPVFFSSGEEVLSGLPSDTSLLLLDISMDGMDGISCARALRDKGISIPIVFITSMEEYSLKGYEVHAFGFLVKPVTYTVFSKVVKEALQQSQVEKPRAIHVRTSSGISVVNPDDLIYAEVFKHETSFVFTGERINSTVQLAAVEPMLIPFGFFRCHRSYVISLKKIVFIGKDYLTMENGDTIPLSKHRRKEFLDAYSDAMGVNLS